MNLRRSIIFSEDAMGTRNYMPTPRRACVVEARCKAPREVLS